MITEGHLEQLCLDWFRAGGYEVVTDPSDGDSPERDDAGQVLHKGRLLAALQRINPNIPSSVLEEQVVHVLSKSDSPVLIQNNRQFQRFLLEGVPV